MDIPTPQPNTPDIYSLGFSKDLNRPVGNSSTGLVYNAIGDTTNAAQILQGGSLNLASLSIGGLVKQISPGDDLQAAINSINRSGGGTVQLLAKTYSIKSNINLLAGVNLIGSGVDQTVIDFTSGNYAINCIGTSGANITNFSLQNLTVKNSSTSTYTGAVTIKYGNSFFMQNIKVTTCTVPGISLYGSSDFFLVNCVSSLHTGASSHGFFITADGSGVSNRYTLFNCLGISNGGDGFNINTGSNNMFYYGLTNCRAASNVNGFTINSTGASVSDSSLTDCVANTNSGKGFITDSGTQRVSFIGCYADTNTGNGFDMGGSDITIIGCYSGTPFNVPNRAIFVNNLIAGGPSNDPKVQAVIGESGSYSAGNKNESTRTRTRTIVMQNTDGATLNKGNVVILKSASSGDQIGTTNTNGDNKVFGMIESSTISNNSWGEVLAEGYTSNLWVKNGLSSISIGDWLSAYSEAYYAKKAITGDTIFAMALSSPTTSTAVINALIVSPRLI